MPEQKTEGWDLILEMLDEQINRLERDEQDTDVSLEIVTVTTEVYHRRGKKHPSEYGMGNSAKDLRQKMADIQEDLERLRRARGLVIKAASTPVLGEFSKPNNLRPVIQTEVGDFAPRWQKMADDIGKK